MEFLFYGICLSVILATSFFSYLFIFKKKYENKFKNAIFNYILKPASIIFLTIIAICIAVNFGILYFILYVCVCAGILLIIYGIYTVIEDYSPDIIFTVFLIAIILLIISSIALLTLNFEYSNKELPKEEIILNDYLGEDLNYNERVMIIKISDKEFAIKKYSLEPDTDVNFSFYYSNYNKCEIDKSETNKIVISTIEETGIDLLVYFGLKEPEVTHRSSYIVYIHSDDILYN